MAKLLTDIVNVRLRLPEALRQRLADEAEEAGRSLNSEILWRLGHTFAGEKWDQFVAEAEEQEKRRQEVLEEMRLRPEVQALVMKFLAKSKEKKKGEGKS
jgi:hypothetical protein